MKRARIRAGGRDRVVADAVAVGARRTVEDRLHDALTALVGDGLREVPHDLVETLDCRRDSGSHLLDFPCVLDNAGLRRALLEERIDRAGLLPAFEAVLLADFGDERIDAFIDSFDDSEVEVVAKVLRKRVAQLVDVAARHADLLLDFLERGAAPDPHFAVARIREEFVGLRARARLEEVRGLTLAGILGVGLDDEHRIGLLIGAEARVVRKRRVGAELIVAIVAADLEAPGGKHHSSCGHRLDETVAPCGREIGNGTAACRRERLIPPLGEEAKKSLARGALAAGIAPRLQIVGGLGGAGL